MCKERSLHTPPSVLVSPGQLRLMNIALSAAIMLLALSRVGEVGVEGAKLAHPPLSPSEPGAVETNEHSAICCYYVISPLARGRSTVLL